jgi:photosystem II stability/assembly factor-like uncharacterized protein
VVNDAQILPTGRLLLATESQGVLRSDNGGESFAASNQGFLHRAAVDLAVDPARPERVLVRLGTSPETLAVSEDGGRSWKPLGGTRKPAGIRRLYGTPWGWWAALAGGGIERWDEGRKNWAPFGWTAGSPSAVKSASTNSKPAVVIPRLSAVVEGMAFAGERVFLATDRGLFAGDRRGRFSLLPAAKIAGGFRAVSAREGGSELWVASRNEMLRSTDGGRSWSRAGMPGNGDQLAWLELVTHPSGDRVLAGTGRAVYVSQDGGKLWLQLGSGLPATPAKRVAADGGRVVAAMSTGGLFLSEDGGLSWDRVAMTGDVRLFTGLAFTGQGDLIVASKEDGLYRVNLLGLSAEPPGPLAGASKK